MFIQIHPYVCVIYLISLYHTITQAVIAIQIDCVTIVFHEVVLNPEVFEIALVRIDSR